METMTTELADEQRDFLAATRVPASAVLAVGGPGTGKTTALIEAVVEHVGAGARLEQLVVLTWSRPGAQRLRRALVGRLGRSQLAPVITTVPGWCLALQGRYGVRDASGELPRLLTGPEQDLQVRELLAAAGADLWPSALRAAVGTAAFAQQVRTGLARARQHGMDPDDLEAAGRLAGRPEWLGLAAFFEQYLDVLDAEHAWDYAELVHRSRLLLLDEMVRDSLAGQVKGLFCDEFAECDPAQIGLIGQVHSLGVPIAAAADPQTSVFGFRGADPRAVADFSTRFAVAGAPDPVRVDFRTVHRGTDAIRAGMRSLLTRLPTAGARRPSRAVGHGQDRPAVPESVPPRISCFAHDSVSEQTQAVAQELRAAHLSGVGWAEQAVICRSGKGGLAVLAGSLASLGIPVEVAGDEIALAEQNCVIVLLDALGVVLELAEGHPPDRLQLRSLLHSPLCGLDPSALRELGRSLWSAQSQDSVRAAEDLVIDLLITTTVHHAGVSGPIDRPVGSAGHPADPRRGVVQELGTLLGAAVQDVRKGRASYDVLWRLWAGTTWPQCLKSDALSTGTTATAANKDLDAICALFDMASRHVELTGPRGLRTLIAQVGGQEIPGDVARESDPRGRGVQVLTAHRARGREWARVVLVDAAEGQWPGPRRGEGLIAAQNIGEPESVVGPAASSWIQQERRLFALAASRARQDLSIHAVTGSGDNQNSVSRFVTEFGAQIIAPTGHRVHQQTLDALVGELRRTAVDPQSGRALRSAAVRELRALVDLRDDRGALLVPSARPEQWWGRRRSEADPPASGAGAADPDGPVGSGTDRGHDDARIQPMILPAPRTSATVTGKPVELTRLSVTGLERISRCPRCWFLDSRAGGAEPSGPGASVGSLVHLVAEQGVRTGLDAVAMHAAVEDFWPRLVFDVAWRGEVERNATHEMVGRLDRWRCAERGREVLGVEVPIDYELELGNDRLSLSGTIDRLERDTASGRVWIVDFKTGRRAPSRRDVMMNVQLACYQLAVGGGACAQLTGDEPDVGGAELVQLRVRESAARPMMPKVLGQPSLADHPWPRGEGPETGRTGPTWLHDLARVAVGWIRTGHYPAVQNSTCGFCPHRADCPVWAGPGGR